MKYAELERKPLNRSEKRRMIREAKKVALLGEVCSEFEEMVLNSDFEYQFLYDKYLDEYLDFANSTKTEFFAINFGYFSDMYKPVF